MKNGLISHELLLPVTHGIMHRLPGNMKMFRNLRQSQILIIIQIKTIPLALCQERPVSIQKLSLFNDIFYRHSITTTRIIIQEEKRLVKEICFTKVGCEAPHGSKGFPSGAEGS